ncbi:hypothetical protein ACHAW5_000342 [Stephanodiscus triporus]|uniref:RING-type domain-containing protein n=1 Tax=Stephanodiscus triporus TaxID=2934178 RepID=A0ABD3MLM9_9STRA
MSRDASSEVGIVDDAAAAAAAEKRRAIQAIMADACLTDLERRLRVQRLMDGSSSSSTTTTTTTTATCPVAPRDDDGRPPRPTTTTTTAIATTTSAAGVGDADEDGGGEGGADVDVPPCVHYERKCDIIAPCCGRTYGCRLCHDEMSPSCGTMDRHAMERVSCRSCRRVQRCKTNACERCATVFAEYHCPRCNLWTSYDKRPFHCDECGICRVGGRENYRHCVTCCMCVSASVYETHGCEFFEFGRRRRRRRRGGIVPPPPPPPDSMASLVAYSPSSTIPIAIPISPSPSPPRPAHRRMPDKYKNNCPVCREDMFSSRQPPQDLPCGHAIHVNCLRSLAGFDYRCPVCKRSVVSRESMTAAWDARARDIREQPMPPDLARRVDVLCNDCGSRGSGLDWHFLGVRCPGCDGFNTVVERVVSSYIPVGDGGEGGGIVGGGVGNDDDDDDDDRGGRPPSSAADANASDEGRG